MADQVQNLVTQCFTCQLYLHREPEYKIQEPIYNFQDPAYYKVREESITGWMFGFDPTNPGESIPSIAGEYFMFV